MRVERRVGIAAGSKEGVCRRDFLKGFSAASLAAGKLGWTDLMTVRASDLRRRGMACIVLWMQGGPSQFETLDPKPRHDNGGETKAISTSVPGIQIADGLPNLAMVMDDVAIIRSMTTNEANHRRADFLLHTGYPLTAGVKHPAFGAVAAHRLTRSDTDLPRFVRIGSSFCGSGCGGFLGAEFDAYALPSVEAMPAYGRSTMPSGRFGRRFGLLGRVETHTATLASTASASEHQLSFGRASRMAHDFGMNIFDVSPEPAAARAAYGESDFAAGCLLARRLVEAGVTFVEVSMGDWDTHQDNWRRTAQLKAQTDQPFAQLVRDLKQRGLLETTLVVWMGEFGRTPRINARGGRDHYPRAFSLALAGGGIRGGQVIGATDAGGTEVAERPISVADLFQTFCRSMKLDAADENVSPIGCPIKIVDGGSPVEELFV